MAGPSWTEVLCPVCERLFPATNSSLNNIARNGLKQKTCSKSCALKRMHRERPDLARAASEMGRLRKGVPSWNSGVPCRPETKEKLSESGKRRKAVFLEIRRGNGTGMTEAEALLRTVLPNEFIWSYPIALGRRQEGYPTNYKLDFANPTTRVGIEVDGVSHMNSIGRSRDQKKEEKLAELGWSVLRISNRQIFQMFGILKSKDVLTSTRGSQSV